MAAAESPGSTSAAAPSASARSTAFVSANSTMRRLARPFRGGCEVVRAPFGFSASRPARAPRAASRRCEPTGRSVAGRGRVRARRVEQLIKRAVANRLSPASRSLRRGAGSGCTSRRFPCRYTQGLPLPTRLQVDAFEQPAVVGECDDRREIDPCCHVLRRQFVEKCPALNLGGPPVAV